MFRYIINIILYCYYYWLCDVIFIIYYLFQQDDLLLTSAENGDIENIILAITSGANVNVHHLLRVSTLVK